MSGGKYTASSVETLSMEEIEIEIEKLIRSCYSNESDLSSSKTAGQWKDLGRHIHMEARVFFSSQGMACDFASRLELSLKNIALLIKMLGSGPLTSKPDDDKKPRSLTLIHMQRIRALNCLTGALLGCSDLWNKHLDGKSDETMARSSTMDLIKTIGGYVLLFCAPMHDDDENPAWADDDRINQDEGQSDLDDLAPSIGEDVRDAAMDCSCALLELPWVPSFEQHDDTTMLHQLELIMHERIELARQVVQHRCSSIKYAKQTLPSDYSPDYNDDMYDDAETSQDGVTATLSGLSLLVRARRSLCFSVLQSAIEGISHDLQVYLHFTLPDTNSANGSSDKSTHLCTETPMKAILFNRLALEEVSCFISFICSCLLGETDPRCLMQMMTLLHKCQTAFYPSFYQQKIDSSSLKPNGLIQFPTGELFDSVAPYYPIQFSPPPNNIHGITREGLHRALMSVLCYFDRPSPILEDILTNLSAKLFLERVCPSSDSDEKTLNDAEAAAESLQGLRDLSELLFEKTTDLSYHITTGTFHESQLFHLPRCFYLSEESTSALKLALFTCHEKASIHYNMQSQSEDLDTDETKSLADYCRKIVTSVAHDIDFYYQTLKSSDSGLTSIIDQKIKFLWRVFISDLIMSCTSTISSSLQSLKGKVSLAYLASLAACGGIQTLRMALCHCIPVLVNILSVGETVNNADYERMSSAAYGIAALFSSSKTTIAHMQISGLSIHPHPLQNYFVEVISVLCEITKSVPIFTDSTNADHHSYMTLFQIANIKALEAVLLSTPSFLLVPKLTSTIQDALLYLTEQVANPSMITVNNDLNTALSRLLGNLIGKSFSIEASVLNAKDRDVSGIFGDPDMALYTQTKIVPIIILSSLMKKQLNSTIIWNILSDACSMGPVNASTSIISQIMDALVVSVHRRFADDSSTDDDHYVSLSMALSHIILNGGEAPRLAFFNLSSPHSTIFNLIDSLAQSTADADPGMSSLLLPSKHDDLRLVVKRRVSY